MRRGPHQNLLNQGVQAAFDFIHFKHDPQLLVGLLLPHAEGFVFNRFRYFSQRAGQFSLHLYD